MTPAIRLLKQKKINYKTYRYEHNISNISFGLDVVEKLSLNKKEVFKTLIVCSSDGVLAVVVAPVSDKVSMKKIAKVLKKKKVNMANVIDAEKSSGYIQGGISPLGQKRKLKTIIDISAKESQNIYISGGQRGLEIEINPNDLQKLTNAISTDILA